MAPGLLFNFVLMKILLASFGHIYKCALIGDITKQDLMQYINI